MYENVQYLASCGHRAVDPLLAELLDQDSLTTNNDELAVGVNSDGIFDESASLRNSTSNSSLSSLSSQESYQPAPDQYFTRQVELLTIIII